MERRASVPVVLRLCCPLIWTEYACKMYLAAVNRSKLVLGYCSLLWPCRRMLAETQRTPHRTLRSGMFFTTAPAEIWK
jgi:hypothetical protein